MARPVDRGRFFPSVANAYGVDSSPPADPSRPSSPPRLVRLAVVLNRLGRAAGVNFRKRGVGYMTALLINLGVGGFVAILEGTDKQRWWHRRPPPETLRLYYRAYVEVAYECLRENGYPTNPPPSVDGWVENYPDVWHPHEVIWAGETGRVDTGSPTATAPRIPLNC